ncbi:MAG: hypothetical protein L3V56_09365 [Candidatus Magnetoovum sp. WYHC-5]|nr:hypothetical protein [Candidatus Magnetoovum sp. WYHC-5]
MEKANLLAIFIAVMITNNVILSQFLGLCAYFGVSDSLRSAFSMGITVTFVIVIASAVSWFLDYYLLIPYHMEFLKTIVFILVIATLVQLIEMFIAKNIPLLQRMLGIYLPLVTTNCAVLGITLVNSNEGFNFIESLVNGLGAGLGYMLAICLMAGIRGRLMFAKVPRAMQGMPINFLIGAMMALAFFGFQGFLIK